MSAQYLAPRTTRALIRAGFDVIGTAAVRRGIVIARRDGQWIVASRGNSATARTMLTIAEAIAEADRLERVADETNYACAMGGTR